MFWLVQGVAHCDCCEVVYAGRCMHVSEVIFDLFKVFCFDVCEVWEFFICTRCMLL
jgi:hypothetical protein